MGDASMTIEKLLDLSSSEWEKLTDAQLLEFFKPYLNVTRPDLAAKPEHEPRKVSSKEVHFNAAFNAKKAKAMAIAKQLGIELNI